ncbi:MAG TPA: chloride channel protein [Candidatus Binatia bacterium]|nr:chloride channel protein [Candidatus Binatia bacterium]
MREKGDFTASPRLLFISAIAIGIGALCAFVAVALTWLIGLCTNLFFYQRFAAVFRSPAEHQLGWAVVAVPVIGGLIIGCMARFGSERIRGHGIPEAMEAILIGESRMQAKVAILKPISSAISIGSGGPFGAEGPIILTGGAFGSLIAQAFHLSASERKTLLVAGAAGGMSATFATPVAAVMLAVELLLFEWKPRSVVPVALASAMAAAIRPHLVGAGPLFPVPTHPAVGALEMLSALIVGILAGVLSAGLTAAVYGAEDAFQRLPIHWMWWPAIGGAVVGIGGALQPHALGVGYDTIAELLRGEVLPSALIGLILVKASIWAIALGSGTSGGVLAPLLIMGSALGALEGTVLPGGGKALWPLVSMAAVLGGTMRSPFTSVIFALELTSNVNALLPCLVASIAAHGFTVLVMKRSILTEKVARRGYHVSREYSVDPLELLEVKDVMTTEVVTLPLALPVKRLVEQYFGHHNSHKHQGYPVLDQRGQLVGIVTRSNLLEPSVTEAMEVLVVADILEREPLTVSSEESCRSAAETMAQARVGRLPVVAPDDPRRLVGILTRSDLLKPRARAAADEYRRERFIDVKWRATRRPADVSAG